MRDPLKYVTLWGKGGPGQGDSGTYSAVLGGQSLRVANLATQSVVHGPRRGPHSGAC